MVHPFIGLDFETYCELDIKKVGADCYVNHPSFKVLIAGVCMTNSTQFHVDFVCHDYPLTELEMLLRQTGTLVAQNVGFEMLVMKHLFPHKYASWDYIDSAVISRARGGGSKLEETAAQFLPILKMPEGKGLIDKFSKGPKPPTQAEVEGTTDWNTFIDYCIRDAYLSFMMQLRYALSSDETMRSQITFNMNMRGWYVDMASVLKMQERYEKNKRKIIEAFYDRQDPTRTFNFNSSPQLHKFCTDRGVVAKSFDKVHVPKMIRLLEKRLKLKLKPQARENYEQVLDMLLTKQELGGSSLSKLQKIIDLTAPDGRLRNQYVHAGASQSLRTSGAGVQMQNLKRLHDIRDMSELFDSSIDWSNDAMAENLRQVFMAEHPDGQIIVGDFSSVESRGLAWLADEQWKIEAYTRGEDIYKLTADKKYKVGVENITKDQRTFGKVGELSCGYQAGDGAVVSFAEGMGITLTDTEAGEIVHTFREGNPKIVKLWYDLQAMLERALAIPLGSSTSRLLANGRLQLFISALEDRESLQKQFSGGRRLSISLSDNQSGDVLFTLYLNGVHLVGKEIRYFRGRKNKDGFWAPGYSDPKTGEWKYYTIYGGKFAGTLTQAMCRVLFFDALERLSDKLRHFDNAWLIGQFHDEAVVEWWPTEAGLSLNGAVHKVKTAMTGSSRPAFHGFPLVAEVNHDHRYIK